MRKVPNGVSVGSRAREGASGGGPEERFVLASPRSRSASAKLCFKAPKEQIGKQQALPGGAASA